MTPEQFDTQQTALQAILTAIQDAGACLHALVGVAHFAVHVESGLLFVVLIYGIIGASQRRKGGE